MLLEHMILSHHGEPEFGAAVRPLFLEAELLSELDLMDARVYQIHEAITPLKEDDFSGRLWALDNRKYIITDLPIIKGCRFGLSLTKIRRRFKICAYFC